MEGERKGGGGQPPPRSRPVDVRRLAAVDMHGAVGTTLRRRVILAEFVAGALVCTALGLLVLLPSPPSAAWAVLGAILLGAGINYAPLAVYAAKFSAEGALEAELAGVDLPAELRFYTKAQAWIAVPALFLALDIWQRRGAERS